MSQDKLRPFLKAVADLPEEYLGLYLGLTKELMGQDPEGLAKELRSVLGAHVSKCKLDRERVHVIDCSTYDPHKLWQKGHIVEHDNRGNYSWVPGQGIKTFGSHGIDKVRDLRRKLKDYQPLNVNVLEYLLTYKFLLDSFEEGKKYVFAGTKYSFPAYPFGVVYGYRYIQKVHGKWQESYMTEDEVYPHEAVVLLD